MIWSRLGAIMLEPMFTVESWILHHRRNRMNLSTIVELAVLIAQSNIYVIRAYVNPVYEKIELKSSKDTVG